MTDRLIADIEIQIEDIDFELLKNALEKFELDVAPAFECIKRNSIADDE